MSNGLGARLPRLCLLGIGILYLCFGGLYLTAERPNQDEGWYLYAAKLVGDGQRPYVDFAYVQPPLLPYVYHLLGGDRKMAAGRAVSVFFGFLTVLLVGLAGWRGGPAGGLLAAALLAFCPFVVSQLTVVKAYALTNACLALGLCLAVHARGRTKWLVGAGVGFALAALTRNSVAVALLVYWLWVALSPERRNSLKFVVPVSLGLVLLAYLPFLLADASAVEYHLLRHHARNTVQGDAVTVVFTVLVRIVVVGRQMVAACQPLAVAVLAGLGLLLATSAETRETMGELALCLLLALTLAIGHFVSMHPYQEYQVVVLPALGVLAGLAWGEIERRTNARRLVWIPLSVLAGVVPILAIGPTIWALPGNQPGPDGRSDPRGVFGPLGRVAYEVVTNSRPDDELLSFQTDVAVESQRKLCGGLTLASFSFTDDPDAARWHLVNPQLLTELLDRADPAVVVLSPGDLSNLLRGQWTEDDRLVVQDGLPPESQAVYQPLIEALDQNYTLVARVPQVGQFFETFSVLVRRGSAL